MDILILFTIVLASLVFAACVCTRYANRFIIGFCVAAGVSSAMIYFIMPALTFVGVLCIIALFAVWGGVLGILLGERTNLIGVIGFAGGLVILLMVGLGAIFAPIVFADQLYSLPHVTVHQETNTSLVSSNHIREVSMETAVWRSEKVIGNLGYKDQIGQVDIQSINGSLVWLAPLDYNGGIWKAWTYGSEGTDGYVIVQAEDAKAQAVLVDKIPLRYTENAIFGYDLQRTIYFDYPGYYVGEHTFQLDGNGNPKWVTMLSNPAAAGVIGNVPHGIVITDPINGKNEFYYMNEIPSWVERVMDEQVTEEYLVYWGAYKHGYWNTWFSQLDYLKPTGGLVTEVGQEGGAVRIDQSNRPDVYMIRGTDGNLYWFGSFTTVGKDASMVGYMLTNLKTGEFNFYPSPSIYNDIGAAKNVQQHPEVAKVMGARVTQPIMYMINGEEIWIMPVITPSGENVMMGVVRAKTGETFVASNLEIVLKELDDSMGIKDTKSPVISQVSLDEIINELTATLNRLKQYKTDHALA